MNDIGFSPGTILLTGKDGSVWDSTGIGQLRITW